MRDISPLPGNEAFHDAAGLDACVSLGMYSGIVLNAPNLQINRFAPNLQINRFSLELAQSLWSFGLITRQGLAGFANVAI